MKKKKHQKPKHSNKQLPGSGVSTSFRKHVLPPLLGLFTMFVVLAWFNSQLIASKLAALTYKAPANVAAADEIAAQHKPDPNAPSRILINGIDVEAPVLFDQTTVNEANFQKALQNGVVHYPNTAKPGQPGNVVIFGHSSGQVWAPGNYKFIFSRLEKLKNEDKIFVDFQGFRYIYRVTESKVVPPTDLSVLNPTEENTLTLITCTPVGTNTNRLIIVARQVSPNPAQSTQPAEPAHAPHTELNQLPGNTPSSWRTITSVFN